MKKQFFLAGWMGWLCFSSVWGEVLLYDDFNTGIDPTVWSTPFNTANANRQTSWVEVNGDGKAQLSGRSLLATVEDFIPSEYGGITVSGTFQHLDGNSTFLSIVDYADGLNSSNSSGIAKYGLEFRYRKDTSAFTGCWRNNGNTGNGIVSLLTSSFSAGATLANLGTYMEEGVSFEFVDNGQGLASVRYTSLNDPTKQWQQVYQYDLSAIPKEHLYGKIGFQNHETARDYLDDIQMSAMRGGFTDNFDGPLFNSMNWTRRGRTQSAVVIDNQGRLTLYDRSGVATRSEFAPTLSQMGTTCALNISGDLTFGCNDDLITFLTRSDNSFNTADNLHAYNGLQFQINLAEGFTKLGIYQKGNNFDIEIQESDLNIDFENGKTYHFDIVDDGTNVSLFIYDLLDESNSGYVTATATLKTGSLYNSNFFVMYNREGERTSYIDHFSLAYIPTQVPEPATWLLLILSMAGLFYSRKKGSFRAPQR